MSGRGGSFAVLRLPRKAPAEKHRLRGDRPPPAHVVQRPRPPLLPRVRVCLYRVRKLGGIAHPLQAARPPVPGSGSRTWSAPAASPRKAGIRERGAGGREPAPRSFACCSPSPAPSPTAQPSADSASPPSIPFAGGELEHTAL